MLNNIKIISICFVLFLLAGCGLDELILYPNNSDSEITTETTIEPEVITKEPIEYTATISAIGDILIHSPLYKDAYVGQNKYDFTKMLTRVKPYLESADITIANSESMIGGQQLGLSSYPKFNSPFEVGDALKYVGVDVVNLANNHTLDRGERAIINATNYWNQLDITYVGAATSIEEAETVKTVTANNIVFSFLGYTYGTNGLVAPAGKEYLVNYINDDKITSDIQKARELSDIVVVNLHMGTEYERDFNERQSRLAQLAADAGADIVFMHHPHVLQPTKWYTGVYGTKTFVIHSLGNFLSGQDQLQRRIGGIMQLDVTKTIDYDPLGNEITSIEIHNPSLLLTFVKYVDRRNFEVLPLHEVTEAELYNVHSVFDDVQTHMKKYMPELQVQ